MRLGRLRNLHTNHTDLRQTMLTITDSSVIVKMAVLRHGNELVWSVCSRHRLEGSS